MEGITEKILLPEFAKAAGFDFNKNGVKIISSGGKNRLLRIYQKLINETDVPVFMVLDADAENLIDSNIEILRPSDDVYVLSNGEFEDILPDELICRALNKYYKFMNSVCIAEITGTAGKANLLTDLYRLKGFGDFKKSEFASIIAENINSSHDIAGELKDIINLIIKAARERVI